MTEWTISINETHIVLKALERGYKRFKGKADLIMNQESQK